MNAIVNLFGDNTALNDYLVYKFVCRNKKNEPFVVDLNLIFIKISKYEREYFSLWKRKSSMDYDRERH